jgi:hypothetical protein
MEHDQTIYQDAAEMVVYVSRTLSDAAEEAGCAALLAGVRSFPGKSVQGMPIEWYFDEGPRHHQGLLQRHF